jgi:hypothetical protein
MSIDQTLTDLMDAAFKRQIVDVRAPMHGTISSYNETTQLAEVQPLLFLQLDQGKTVPAEPVTNVPVAWLGGGNYTITWPLVTGALVQLVPQDSELSSWVMSGSVGAPPSREKATLQTAVAIPLAARPGTAPLPATAYAADGLVIGADKTYIGSSAVSDAVALAAKVLTELQAIKSTFDDWKTALESHTHAAGTLLLDSTGALCTGSTAGAPASLTTQPTPSSVASLKVLCD